MFVINNWNSTDSKSTIPVVRYDLSPFHSCPPHCMITVIILSDIHFPKFLVMLQCIQKYMYIMYVYIFFLKKSDHREVKSFFPSTYSFHVHYWTGNVINEQDWGVVECVCMRPSVTFCSCDLPVCFPFILLIWSLFLPFGLVVVQAPVPFLQLNFSHFFFF